jgi:hypothetical protein
MLKVSANCLESARSSGWYGSRRPDTLPEDTDDIPSLPKEAC